MMIILWALYLKIMALKIGIFKLFGNSNYSVLKNKWIVIFPPLQNISTCSFADAVEEENQKEFLLA
jgi:hypothetical protein